MTICAICTAEGPTRPTNLHGDGVLFNVCARCNEEHPRDGGYSFGESVRDGVHSHVAANAISTLGNGTGRRTPRRRA